ncbi:MAG TPA: hypothetical protein DCX54_07770 [Flavobacteriales bacterium]|nr:hypothetical protein [Flavobacteriales bacterium]
MATNDSTPITQPFFTLIKSARVTKGMASSKRDLGDFENLRDLFMLDTSAILKSCDYVSIYP